MPRVIQQLASDSLAPATETFLPAGTRLWQITVENSNSPTADFVVLEKVYGAAASYVARKFVGVRNGAPVKLYKDYKATNVNATPSVRGDYAISIIAGTGVYGVVQYVASTPPSE